MNGLGARPAGRSVRHARPHRACRRPSCPRSGPRGVRRRITRVFRRGAYRPHSPSGFRPAGPRSRPPRPAGPWRGRRSQARRVDRQRARRPLGAGGRRWAEGSWSAASCPNWAWRPACHGREGSTSLRLRPAAYRTSSAATSPRVRPGKARRCLYPYRRRGRPAVSRNGLSTAARWESSVTRWTTTTETRSPTLPPHFADGISVAHVHPTSTSPTRLFERESDTQAVVAGEYHPLNGEASESRPGASGRTRRGSSREAGRYGGQGSWRRSVRCCWSFAGPRG